jgi:hypothetical protein
MPEPVKIEGAFEVAALRVLREIPGLTVMRLSSANDVGVDAVIEFAGERRPVALEFKQRANAATAWQLVHYARAHPEMPLLLIAGESTAESRAILRRHGVALVDGLGNAHVEVPGLLLHLEGPSRGRAYGRARPPRLAGKAGVIAQALLLHPDRPWHIKDLAKEATVSAGLAHRVLDRLETESIVATEGTGPKTVRKVVDSTALLDLWAEEEKSRPTRTPGYVLAQTPRQLIEKVATGLERAEINHALTGAAAASLIAPFVTALPIVEVWVTAIAAPDSLQRHIGGEQVQEGANVIVLQQNDDTPLAFREQRMGAWVSNRLRIYVDLLRDPRRGREQAQHLRTEVIGY